MRVQVITDHDIKELINDLEKHVEHYEGGAAEAAESRAVERACQVLASLLDDMLINK